MIDSLMKMSGGGSGGGAGALEFVSLSAAAPAEAGIHYLCDATTAAFTVTLPASPSDGDQIAITKVDDSLNAVTVNVSGKDVFSAFATPRSDFQLAINGNGVHLIWIESKNYWLPLKVF